MDHYYILVYIELCTVQFVQYSLIYYRSLFLICMCLYYMVGKTNWYDPLEQFCTIYLSVHIFIFEHILFPNTWRTYKVFVSAYNVQEQVWKHVLFVVSRTSIDIPRKLMMNEVPRKSDVHHTGTLLLIFLRLRLADGPFTYISFAYPERCHYSPLLVGTRCIYGCVHVRDSSFSTPSPSRDSGSII